MYGYYNYCKCHLKKVVEYVFLLHMAFLKRRIPKRFVGKGVYERNIIRQQGRRCVRSVYTWSGDGRCNDMFFTRREPRYRVCEYLVRTSTETSSLVR